jgi:tetratricopeptide (TPR) repeat protein
MIERVNAGPEFAEAGSGPDAAIDFFVSYTGVNRPWAEWIAWQLKEAKYRVRLQAWHFLAGSNFVAEMQRAKGAKRTLAVISPAYERSAFASAEWQAAFAQDPQGVERRLVPVRVEDYQPTGLLAPIVYVDLVGLESAQASMRLLGDLDRLRVPGGGEPTTPPVYPGTEVDAASGAMPLVDTHHPPRYPKGLPSVWTVPLSPNRHFGGREFELAALQTAFVDLEQSATTPPWVLTGLGGVGKTQLAVEYAYSTLGRYRAVLWVAAESRGLELGGTFAPGVAFSAEAALVARVSELLDRLVPSDQVAQLPREQTERIAKVRRWLADNQDWLLVLDNLDTPEVRRVALRLLPELRRGHVLFTSRISSGWPVKCHPYPLPLLSNEAAQTLLMERVESPGEPDERQAAAAIAEALGNLPLALEQAAATVARRRWSLNRYLERLRTESPRLMAEPAPGGTELEGPRAAVATTWAITEADLSAEARTVLRLLSFFAPAELPRSVFEAVDDAALETALGQLASSLAAETSAGDAAKRNAPKAFESTHLEDALVELSDHSFISLQSDTLSAHRLVLEVQQRRVPPEARPAWLQVGLRLLEVAIPGDPTDARTRKKWRALEPHLLATVTAADEAGVAAATARLMNGVALFMDQQARWQEAEPLIRRALVIDEKSFGPEHPNVAGDLNNLAQLLQTTNRLSEAEPLMRRALVIDEKTFGPEHPSVARDLNNLATLLQATNRLSEAEPLMRRALVINEKTFGPEHSRIAIDVNNLATLLLATNRLSEAEPLMRRALVIDERIVGPEHHDVASDLNNLATLLQATNRLSEAEPLMRRALVIDEKSFGPDHPDVAIDLNNLARLLQSTNRLSEAEPLMRRALVIDEKSFGPDHPDVARDLNRLARLLQDTNRPREAEPLMRRALVIVEKSFGPDHPNSSTVRQNLEVLLQPFSLRP